MSAERIKRGGIPRIYVVHCKDCGVTYEVVSDTNLKFVKVPCTNCDNEKCKVAIKKGN